MKRILIIAALLASTLGAHAQQRVVIQNGTTPVSNSNPLPVTVTSGGSDQDVNLVGINGAAPVAGNGTAAGALRVALPTDGTGVVGLNAGSNIIGNVRIDQTTPGTTNGVTALASENHVGEVGGNILPITNAMTTSANAITTGESLGGLQTLTSAVRVSGSLGASGTSGLIQSVMVTFTDAIGSGPLDVYYFNANPSASTCTDNTAFSLNAADRDKVIGIAHVTDFTSSGTPVIAQAQNQAMPFGVASATSIYACVVSRGSITPGGTSNASLLTRILRN